MVGSGLAAAYALLHELWSHEERRRPRATLTDLVSHVRASVRDAGIQAWHRITYVATDILVPYRLSIIKHGETETTNNLPWQPEKRTRVRLNVDKHIRIDRVGLVRHDISMHMHTVRVALSTRTDSPNTVRLDSSFIICPRHCDGDPEGTRLGQDFAQKVW